MPRFGFLPLLCMALLAAVFTNAVFYHVTTLQTFVDVLGDWGFGSLRNRRMMARALIGFEFWCVVGMIWAIGTGITNDRRYGPSAWRWGRSSAFMVLIYLQGAIVLYALYDPLLCGCGPLTESIDAAVNDVWTRLRLPRPEFNSTIPIARNALLSLLAVVALAGRGSDGVSPK